MNIDVGRKNDVTSNEEGDLIKLLNYVNRKMKWRII